MRARKIIIHKVKRTIQQTQHHQQNDDKTDFCDRPACGIDLPSSLRVSRSGIPFCCAARNFVWHLWQPACSDLTTLEYCVDCGMLDGFWMHTITWLHVHTASRSFRFSSDSRTRCSVHVKTNRYGHRSFCDAVPSAWSSVPREIGHNQSTTAFKTVLKAHLLKTDCATMYC